MSRPSGILSFADPLGPLGRRRVVVATVVAAVAVGLALALAISRFAEKGQFDGKLWSPLFTTRSVNFFATGVRNTLQAAVTAMALASLAGVVLALGRLSSLRPLSWLVALWVELFRGVPLVLLILFLYFGLPRYGIDLGRYGFLVLGLVLYNSAVISEIVRAGILSLDHGQSEAAYAIGLTRGQAMRSVVLPQAVRRMVPALVSQMVVMLKDTSLGVVIAYEELLRRGQLAGISQGNPLQAFVVVTVLYLSVNVSLSLLARWLERRQTRGRKVVPAGPIVVTGTEDLSV